jgi:LuxR family transcriptional regulator, maltose regulon positive regulatory protein
LRLRDRPDRSDFIERLTGADWHIVNYLGEEVLATQPAEVREFLLATSVLNRMCAPLGDALTGRADGTGLISEIYRANLFLVPLDDEHRWFRYHHLFGGLLRHELARTAPDRPPVLHQRAAQWYADHGDVAEAIGHAIASGDGALSERLVAAHWRQSFNAGQLETVRMWLDALPAEFVSADASLSAARVWVALDTGRLEEVGAALDAAETSVPQDIQLMVLRALQMYKAGDVGGAAARLREISPSADDPSRLHRQRRPAAAGTGTAPVHDLRRGPGRPGPPSTRPSRSAGPPAAGHREGSRSSGRPAADGRTAPRPRPPELSVPWLVTAAEVRCAQ